jgi:hypothetical protein
VRNLRRVLNIGIHPPDHPEVITSVTRDYEKFTRTGGKVADSGRYFTILLAGGAVMCTGLL